jgi:hypothetical protein
VTPDAGQRAAAFGTWVEVLCGQPEQKVGTRSIGMHPLGQRLFLGLEKREPRLDASEVKKRAMRAAITRAIIAGVSSPAAGRNHWP